MRLAKPAADVGLSTNHPALHRAFWAETIDLPAEGELAIGGEQTQFRFDAHGSVVKVNGFAAPLPPGPPTGYREVLIARAGLSAAQAFSAPDGARVSLVPPGFSGIDQIGVRLAVRDLDAHRRFYAEALGLPEEAPGAFRIGRSLIAMEHDPEAQSVSGPAGAGWRYITIQVFAADAAHARALAHGAAEARAPTTLADVARFSIIRDPDGNAIELSQRKSLTGSLEIITDR